MNYVVLNRIFHSLAVKLHVLPTLTQVPLRSGLGVQTGVLAAEHVDVPGETMSVISPPDRQTDSWI